MNADDIHDYLERVKQAEELGLGHELTQDLLEIDWDQDEKRCKRCRRPTTPDFRSPYCYSCEIAFFGKDA